MHRPAPKLSSAAAARLDAWREADFLPEWARTALDELIGAEAWEELERAMADMTAEAKRAAEGAPQQ